MWCSAWLYWIWYFYLPEAAERSRVSNDDDVDEPEAVPEPPPRGPPSGPSRDTVLVCGHELELTSLRPANLV